MEESYSHMFIERSGSDRPKEQEDLLTESFNEEQINEDIETNHVTPIDYQPLLLDKESKCTQCGSIGHIKRECAFNPESSSFKKLQSLKEIYDRPDLILDGTYSPSREREAVHVSVSCHTKPPHDVLNRSGSDRLKEGEDETNINVNLTQKIESSNKETGMINQIQSMKEISQFFSFLILLNKALTQKSKEAKLIKRISPISKFIDEEKLFVIKKIKDPMFKRNCIMSYFRSRGIDPITTPRRPFQLRFGMVQLWFGIVMERSLSLINP